MFNDLFYDFFNNLNTKETFAVDVVSKDDLYEVYANLPGFTKEEISISFDNGYLTIAAKHADKVEEETNNLNFVLRERSLSPKKRSIYFGDLNEDHISAKLNNGVLNVSIYLKKPEEKEAKSIIIE